MFFCVWFFKKEVPNCQILNIKISLKQGYNKNVIAYNKTDGHLVTICTQNITKLLEIRLQYLQII